MRAQPIHLSDRTARTLRDALRSEAMAMYRVLGCEKTWRALYEIADEIVSIEERERPR